jgi:hypothetical protein
LVELAAEKKLADGCLRQSRQEWAELVEESAEIAEPRLWTMGSRKLHSAVEHLTRGRIEFSRRNAEHNGKVRKRR